MQTSLLHLGNPAAGNVPTDILPASSELHGHHGYQPHLNSMDATDTIVEAASASSDLHGHHCHGDTLETPWTPLSFAKSFSDFVFHATGRLMTLDILLQDVTKP